MLKKSLVTCAVVMLIGVGVKAGAESAGQEAGEGSTTGTMLHLEGCVYVEGQMSARRPIIRPDDDPSFVFSVVDTVAGPEDAVESGRLLKLEQVSPERLRDLMGTQVGVTGRLDEDPQQPTFRVTSIRPISGGCMPLAG